MGKGCTRKINDRGEMPIMISEYIKRPRLKKNVYIPTEEELAGIPKLALAFPLSA